MTGSIGLSSTGFETSLGGTCPVVVVYPADEPMENVSLGPYQLAAAPNAQLGSAFNGRVVLISHGSGGTHLGYLDLAGSLARAGFLVAVPEHPGNNRRDNSLEGRPENLANRPALLSDLLDRISAGLLGQRVGVSTAAVIGHSMGGYTALAIAGGQPKTQSGETVQVNTDDRVRALVLLAPATPWLQSPGALSNVTMPIFMRSGEYDAHTSSWHAEVVLNGLPDGAPVDYQMVANAGHFSFMSTFPEQMTHPGFEPSQDPPGFDRADYQQHLAEEINAFLKEALTGG